jgi:hypothetical protein
LLDQRVGIWQAVRKNIIIIIFLLLFPQVRCLFFWLPSSTLYNFSSPLYTCNF